MRPYYEENGVTIYHGDARELVPLIRADVAITDPPFGVGLVKKTSDYRNSNQWDDGESMRASVLYRDDSAYVAELVRDVIPILLEQTDRAVVFSGTRMLWNYPEPAAVGCVYTSNGAGRGSWGFQCMHPVLFYGRDPFLVDGKGARPNSFATEQPNLERFDHPCPKPQSWLNWAVSRASRPGETIIDPFMGTGTTLVSASRFQRKAIGIDIEERYCEIAVNRLRQGALPLVIEL
jgi:site-specific DNA-methyltransferase (adenine-specific)